MLELKPDVLEKVERPGENEDAAAEESMTDVANESEDDKILGDEDESVVEAAALNKTMIEEDVRF